MQRQDKERERESSVSTSVVLFFCSENISSISLLSFLQFYDHNKFCFIRNIPKVALKTVQQQQKQNDIFAIPFLVYCQTDLSALNFEKLFTKRTS